MTQKAQLTLLHVAGVAVVALSTWLAFKVFPDNQAVQELLIGGACGLYGMLGFAPMKPVLEKAIQKMPPEEVVRIQSMVPPPPPTEAPSPPPAAGVS